MMKVGPVRVRVPKRFVNVPVRVGGRAPPFPVGGRAPAFPGLVNVAVMAVVVPVPVYVSVRLMRVQMRVTVAHHQHHREYEHGGCEPLHERDRLAEPERRKADTEEWRACE